MSMHLVIKHTTLEHYVSKFRLEFKPVRGVLAEEFSFTENVDKAMLILRGHACEQLAEAVVAMLNEAYGAGSYELIPDPVEVAS